MLMTICFSLNTRWLIFLTPPVPNLVTFIDAKIEAISETLMMILIKT
jgi:hypothetical protein